MMSMKIKFRLWSKDRELYVNPMDWNIDCRTGQYFKNTNFGGFVGAMQDEYVLEQFTGLRDNEAVEIYENDLRVDSDGVIFRIYRTFGGFVIKAHYWKSNCQDLIPDDQLIFESLSDPQTADWLCIATSHLSTIHESPELLKQKNNGR